MPEAFQLAIESSAEGASVALARAGKVVASAEAEAGRRQSEALIEPLQEVLSHLDDGRIELVLLGTGPGSYNGARVGIAAGQGVALVHRCPAVGLCSLEALAPVRQVHRCLAVGDARRQTFFTLEIEEGQLSGEVNLLDHAQFRQCALEARELGTKILTLEDPNRLNLPEVEVERAAPSAVLLLQAWAAKSEEEKASLAAVPPEPFYLRPPHITQPKSQ